MAGKAKRRLLEKRRRAVYGRALREFLDQLEAWRRDDPRFDWSSVYWEVLRLLRDLGEDET